MLKTGFVNNATTAINLSNSNWSNPITRLFTVKKLIGSCGVEMPWKIYDANRMVDGMNCSLFVFEKKIGEKLHKPRRKEIICEFLRKEVQQCQGLNHSKILKVLHPLEENNETMAFAAERVIGSLANLLGNDSRLSQTASIEIKKLKLTDLEIKHGIYQLTDCLRYLHTSQQFIHNNINPSVILITNTGHWKIFGTGFLTNYTNLTKDQISELQWSIKVPKMVQPDLDYIAPEVQLGGPITSSVDMFGIGLVICTIYNNGKSLINANKILANYLKKIEELHNEFSLIASSLPSALIEPVEKMLSKDIRYRPNSQLFSLLKYFDDMVLLSIDGIVNFEDKSSEDKLLFLQGLPDILPEYPKELLVGRVYQFLQKYLTESRAFYEPCFQAIMSAVEVCSIQQYSDYFKEGILNTINRAKTNSIQECTTILQYCEPLFYKMSSTDINDEMISLLTQCLDSDIVEAHNAAFDSIKFFRDYLNEQILNTIIVPKIISTFNRRKVVKIRSSALSAMSVVIPIITKATITDEILPFLQDITTNDVDLIMSIMNVYKEVMNRRLLISKEINVQIIQSLLIHVSNPSFQRHHIRSLIDMLHLVVEKIDSDNYDSFESNSEPLVEHEMSSTEAGDTNQDNNESESADMESEIERIQATISTRISDKMDNPQSSTRPSFSIGSPAMRKVSAPLLRFGNIGVKNHLGSSLPNSSSNNKSSFKSKLLHLGSFKSEDTAEYRTSSSTTTSNNNSNNSNQAPTVPLYLRRRQTIDASMSNYRHISHAVMPLPTANTIRAGTKNIKTTPRSIVLNAIAQNQISDDERCVLKQQMTPPPMGRRHSFAFNFPDHSSNTSDLITASVCEGPFQQHPSSASAAIGCNSKSDTNTNGSTRRWQSLHHHDSALRRQSSIPTDRPPVTRQSSFTVLSDAVVNFFCPNNPVNQAKP